MLSGQEGGVNGSSPTRQWAHWNELNAQGRRERLRTLQAFVDSLKSRRAVEADMARIRRRWRQLKRVDPHADAFRFLADIVVTGKIPAVPRKRRSA